MENLNDYVARANYYRGKDPQPILLSRDVDERDHHRIIYFRKRTW